MTKLEKAMAEIKAILKREDITGCIMLHTPGDFKFKLHVEASYTIAKDFNGGFAIIGDVREFGGNKKLLEEAMCNTLDMVNAFGGQAVDTANALRALMEAAREGGEKIRPTPRKDVN